jgi:hypothetical protein
MGMIGKRESCRSLPIKSRHLKKIKGLLAAIEK